MKTKLNMIICLTMALFSHTQAQVTIQTGATIFVSESVAINGMKSTTPTFYLEGNVTNNGSITNQGEIQFNGPATFDNLGNYFSIGDDVFVGSGSKNITGTFNAMNSFFNLVLEDGGYMNNIGTSDVHVSNAVILTNGILNPGAAQKVILYNTSASSLSGAVSSGMTNQYIEGTLRKYINTGQNYIFPVGDNAHGSQLANLTFNNLGGANYIDISYSNVGTGSMTPINITTPCYGTYDVQGGTWTINADGVNGTYDYNITLQPGGLNNMTATYDAMKKDAAFVTPVCAGTLGNTTASNLNSFSTFKMQGGSTVALPVELLEFNVNKLNTSDLVTWVTASEENNYYFNVQRSADGINFETLGRVYSKAPNGNSNIKLDYAFEDEKPLMGHNYYRLEQVDIDNGTNYSKVIDIIWNENNINIYPNPSDGIVNVSFNNITFSQAQILVVDLSGKVLMQVKPSLTKSQNTVKLDLNSFANGIYFIKVYDKNTLQTAQKVRKEN